MAPSLSPNNPTAGKKRIEVSGGGGRRRKENIKKERKKDESGLANAHLHMTCTNPLSRQGGDPGKKPIQQTSLCMDMWQELRHKHSSTISALLANTLLATGEYEKPSERHDITLHRDQIQIRYFLADDKEKGVRAHTGQTPVADKGFRLGSTVHISAGQFPHLHQTRAVSRLFRPNSESCCSLTPLDQPWNSLFSQFPFHVRLDVRRMCILCAEEYIIMLLKKKMIRNHFLYSVERKKIGK